MSATLDTMLSLNGFFADPDLSASTEILARKGRFGGKTVVFFLPLAIIVMIVSWVMRNPGKFRALTDRFRGGTGPNHNFNPYPNNQPPTPGFNAPPPGFNAPPPGFNAAPPAFPPPGGQLPPNLNTVPAAPPPAPMWNTPPNTGFPGAQINPAPQQHFPPAANTFDPQLFAAGPGMQFNAPPGWPAPGPGWTPPAGWQPDPSWPPAPLGWQFWVPLQQSNTGTPPQRFGAGTTYT